MEVAIKDAFGTVVVLCAAILPLRAQEVANPVPVNSTIATVTVCADRARVTRKAKDDVYTAPSSQRDMSIQLKLLESTF